MLIDFIYANWYLFAMLVVIVFLLSMQSSGGAKKVTALQLPQMQNRQAAVVVDVRPAEVFAKGHIAESLSMPFADLKNKVANLNKYKDKPIIIACENGLVSAKAAAVLRRNQFASIYILQGGLATWAKDNLPLVKK